ncbi:11S globulin seed storage protein Jug r 4-like [Corylus avellana]|uniref:11S globulin seed storage protein Jug r 4-like n=1 Tax=Corylus avellana TaxID=13451 RepID=UPI00286AC9B7|nr:11S globulin seed storage protein Jug r 4-like [Corylus avellana]
MANPLFLSLSLCLLFLFNGCLAQTRQQGRQFGQCQLDRLDALEPTNRIDAEAGSIEAWDPNNQQFRCAGVAVVRSTIEPRGLLLPHYHNAPQLTYIVRGRGFQGTILPGCPETFQESMQQSQQQQQEGQSESFQQDRHQKIQHFREGDIIALPAGVAHWAYNDGDSPVVAVSLLDIGNSDNELDEQPRSFFLAGNPEDEFRQQGQPRRQQQRRPGQRGEEGQQQQGEGNNVFSGFDAEFLADAFNVDEDTARKLQGNNDNRRHIVRVEGDLQVLRPQRSREQWEREESQERESERERERQRQREGRGREINGFEETICSLRLRENIGSRSRADIYTEQVGRINTVNSNTLPVLRWLQLSAERGDLNRDALYVPHWNQNAHSVVYAIRGRARVQVVDDNGNTVFDDELRQGQVLTIPQNFVVAKRAESEGFEWVAFKTNDNAQINTLAGRTSALRALPDYVLANAFQISREEARKLKYNRQETTLGRSSRSSSERRTRSESEGRRGEA